MSLKFRIRRTIRRLGKMLTPPTEVEYAVRKYRKYRANHPSRNCGSN